MKNTRHAWCFLLVAVLMSTPALAQQPLQDAATKAAAAAGADERTPGQIVPARRTTFWTGTILMLAGGTAVILGTTVSRSAKTTSGNTPPSGFDRCEALKANPIYRGNECDVLKGPNLPVVISGAVAAAAGSALMMLGSSNSSVDFSAGGVRLRHRVTF